MIEVIIPGVRHGEAVIDTSVAYNGAFCYISGINANGYQKMNVPLTTANARKSIYPVNKYYFSEDYSDTSDSVDKLTKGDMVIYYDGGEYETDQFYLASLLAGTAMVTHWDVYQGLATSNWGRKTYVPGTDTAQASWAAAPAAMKLWVGTAGDGKLYGSTAWLNGAVNRAVSTPVATEGYVGFIVGIHYEDSSNARIRYRISPGSHCQSM